MAREDNAKIYDIPDNFIDESRILKGMFKTRNFIEGLILAIIVLPIALLIPTGSINARLMIIVAICGPLFLFGNAGFNGDPLSTTLINARKWFKSRGVMLYNYHVRALIKAPLTAMMEKELPRDKIVDMIDNFKEKQMERAAKEKYIEGETFEFAEDNELEDIYADKYYYVEMFEDEDGNLIELPETQTIDMDSQTIEAVESEKSIEQKPQDDKKDDLNLDAIFNNKH